MLTQMAMMLRDNTVWQGSGCMSVRSQYINDIKLIYRALHTVKQSMCPSLFPVAVYALSQSHTLLIDC